MKILFAASEGVPFIATGGLADVVGSLPLTLCSCDVDCRAVIPMYSALSPALRARCRFVDSFYVKLGWRNQYCGVFEVEHKNTVFYLLDNEYYFGRGSVYGEFDDAERFSFFSKAILEMISRNTVGFVPELIHCNDWQTAMVPVFLNAFYRGSENLRHTKTVFTIHNIAYQGRFALGNAEDVAGLSGSYIDKVTYDGDFNMMKGAIEEADSITTVSPTYAHEILNPWFSYGLDRILGVKQHKLTGILNGIDNSVNNPHTDQYIEKNYSFLDTGGKQECKLALQRKLGLHMTIVKPMIAMITRLVEMKGIDLLCYVLDELMQRDIQVVVLGIGDSVYESFLHDRAKAYTGKLSFCNQFSVELSHQIYAGADIFLMPSKSEPCGLAQMIALRYGTIPVVRETGGLVDSIRDLGGEDGTDIFLMPSKSEPCGLAQMIALRYGTIPVVRETGGLVDSIRDLGGEDGNGFTFKTYNAHDMLDAINRALELYNDERAWLEAVKKALMCNFSWEISADKYIELYKSVILG